MLLNNIEFPDEPIYSTSTQTKANSMALVCVFSRDLCFEYHVRFIESLLKSNHNNRIHLIAICNGTSKQTADMIYKKCTDVDFNCSVYQFKENYFKMYPWKAALLKYADNFEWIFFADDDFVFDVFNWDDYFDCIAKNKDDPAFAGAGWTHYVHFNTIQNRINLKKLKWWYEKVVIAPNNQPVINFIYGYFGVYNKNILNKIDFPQLWLCQLEVDIKDLCGDDYWLGLMFTNLGYRTVNIPINKTYGHNSHPYLDKEHKLLSIPDNVEW